MTEPEPYVRMRSDILFATTINQVKKHAADIVRDILTKNPSFGVAELQKALDEQAAEATAALDALHRKEYADCANCGAPILRRQANDDAIAWRHDDEYFSAGCRSARRLSDGPGAWEASESMKKHWRAKPKPGTIRSEEEGV